MALTYVSGEFRGDSFPYAAGVTAIAPGDPLTLVAGKAQLAAAGDPIAAVAEKWYPSDPKGTGTYSTIPNTTSNVTVPDDDAIYSIPTSDASAALVASVGKYANISGASNAVKLDITTISATPVLSGGSGVAPTTKQLAIIGLDPTNVNNYLVNIYNGQFYR